MKHLAAIQIEFVKKAAFWDKLSPESQHRYLKQHPKSKRRLTAKPESESVSALDIFRAQKASGESDKAAAIFALDSVSTGTFSALDSKRRKKMIADLVSKNKDSEAITEDLDMIVADVKKMKVKKLGPKAYDKIARKWGSGWIDANWTAFTEALKKEGIEIDLD
jgi:hypothetical protein